MTFGAPVRLGGVGGVGVGRRARLLQALTAAGILDSHPPAPCCQRSKSFPRSLSNATEGG